MNKDERKRFFAGAVQYGTLPEAFWQVASDADGLRGDHEAYVREVFSDALAADRDARTDAPAKRDWRIGCSVKPKMRTHELYYERGEIVEVFPSGTAGIHDKDGVLQIRMQTGRVLMAPADDWMTA